MPLVPCSTIERAISYITHIEGCLVNKPECLGASKNLLSIKASLHTCVHSIQFRRMLHHKFRGDKFCCVKAYGQSKPGGSFNLNLQPINSFLNEGNLVKGHFGSLKHRVMAQNSALLEERLIKRQDIHKTHVLSVLSMWAYL